MKKGLILAIFAVVFNGLCFNAESAEKVKVLTLEVETEPIAVKADAPAPQVEETVKIEPVVVTPEAVKEEAPKMVSLNDKQAKNFYEQKIKLMEKCLELKSQHIELLRESVAQRDSTIHKLETMIE